MKKLGRFLSSMGFAVALLVLLAAACALSSLVEQGLTREAYEVRYGSGMASIIMALQVNDAYHSVWFIALSGFLCLNLLLCSVLRFSSFLRRYRQEKDSAAVNTPGNLGETETEQPEQVFRTMRLTPLRCTDAQGKEALFASGNRVGVWGAWICHVGVLLLIAGFALGQITMQESVIWGIPGDTRILEGTGIEIVIDDFRTETREDASIAQYVTEITVNDPAAGRPEKATISVNNPADAGGFRLYQNNTGTAVSASVKRDGKETQRKTLLPQQAMAESVLGLEDQPEYAFYFAGIRKMQEEGQEDQTLYVMDLYRNGVFQQSYYYVGDGVATVGGDEITFSPRTFTLLAARKDSFAPMALLGGIITLLGLALAFLFQPRALWAVRGEDGKWSLRGRCRKGQALMQEQLEAAVRNVAAGEEEHGKC
jgi:cytochrome c biogenesis protein